MPAIAVSKINKYAFDMRITGKMLGRGQTSIIYPHPTSDELAVMFTLDDWKLRWYQHLGLCESFDFHRTASWPQFKSRYYERRSSLPRYINADIYVGIVKRLQKVPISGPLRRAVSQEYARADKLREEVFWGERKFSSTHHRNWTFWTELYDRGTEPFPTLYAQADYIINECGEDIHPDLHPSQWMADGDRLLATDTGISAHILRFLH